MKTLCSIILLLLSNICSANLIDSIKNKTDLKLFLARYAKEVDYVLYDSQQFYKIDIDKNGLTDVCINASNFWVVLDKGENKLEPHYFQGAEFFYKGFVETDSTNYLRVRIGRYQGNRTTSYSDTLITYKNGRFLEYVKSPTTHSIQSVEFDYRPGFCLECDSYKMVLDSTRQARYAADKINFKRNRIDTIKGNLALNIPDYNRITDLLNYMKFEQLDEDYFSGGTDQSSGSVTIRYDNGKTKKIHDYGLRGTLLLSHFYDILIELYETKKWNQTIVRGPRLKNIFK